LERGKEELQSTRGGRRKHREEEGESTEEREARNGRAARNEREVSL